MPQPIREFYRLALSSEGLQSLSGRIISIAESEIGTAALVPPERAVVFHSMSGRDGPEEMFFGRSAVDLVGRLGISVQMDIPVPPKDLPSGLALLIGDAVDVDEYSRLQKL